MGIGEGRDTESDRSWTSWRDWYSASRPGVTEEVQRGRGIGGQRSR
jgi:hypothetical protein